jgi:glyoxylase-like metal-dependent hydrolase (beta-lactamase superfamily II)
MHLGQIEVRHIHGGNFYLDGGAMFGVVPKPLWDKKSPPDGRNRIRLAANSLVARTAGKNILIETGNGTKWTPKLRDIYGVQDGDPLAENLAAAGVGPERIDLVINTHLHFDHAGGNTKIVHNKAVPAFRNAHYVVQAGELFHARNPTERDRASYFEENFLPMEQSEQWRNIAWGLRGPHSRAQRRHSGSQNHRRRQDHFLRRRPCSHTPSSSASLDYGL